MMKFSRYHPYYGPQVAREHTKMDPKLDFRTINSISFNQCSSNLAWELILVVSRHDAIFKVSNPYYGHLVAHTHTNVNQNEVSGQWIHLFSINGVSTCVRTHIGSVKTYEILKVSNSYYGPLVAHRHTNIDPKWSFLMIKSEFFN